VREDRPVRLDELLSSVVTPVLGELLPDVDLQEIAVSAEPGGAILLRVVAGGEPFGFWVHTPGRQPESPTELRHRLADQLQDHVAETRFGWGQLRPHPF
jgi:hypothetical protein